MIKRFTVRFLTIILTILSLQVLMLEKVQAAENLIMNGSFEETTSNLPMNWDTNLWDGISNGTEFKIESEGANSGSSYITIDSKTANDAKLVQKIVVKPDTVYMLSCFIRAEDILSEAKGANITVLNIVDTSTDFYDTSGAWKQVKLYGKTDKAQTEIQVCVRLGGYGSLNKGKASFDDFTVEEVTKVPEGVKVVNFYPSDKVASQAKLPKANIALIFFIILLFLGLFAICLYAMSKKRALEAYVNNKREKTILIFILTFALLIRVILAPLTPGFDTDVGTFIAWANIAATNGLSSFYTTEMFVDYPPGYIYVLYFIGKIRSFFGIGFNSSLMLLLIKLPAILADIACSYMIYNIAKKRVGIALALILCTLYALNPAIIINSAVWAQVDAVLALFIILMLSLALEGKLIKASIIFTIAVLIKPQALIFTPVLLFMFIQKKSIRLFLYSGLSSFIALIILIFPFSINQTPLWIIDQYKSTLSSYAYSSVNAFNLFSLTGNNWLPDTNKLLLLSSKAWGSLFIVLIVAFSVYVFFKSKKSFRIPYIAFFIITSVFTLSTKMHERYLFPAIILGIAWYIFSKDKRALYLFAALSITHYINVAYVLDIASYKIYQIPNGNGVMTIISLINCILLIWIIKIGIEYTRNIPVKEIVHDDNLINLQEKLIVRDHVTFVKKDFIMIAVLVFIYSIIAFINLGSTKVPSTFWQPTNVGEGFYVDFGEEVPIKQINYYSGLGQGSSQLSFSKDEETWEQNTPLNQEDIYVWKSLKLDQKARYIKITSEKAGEMFYEIGFYGAASNVPYTIKNVIPINISPQDRGKLENIFDEQGIIPAKPSYKTGMIFDEIYHARTAYEQLHKLPIYEWTHPPLGKIIMSIGIMIFGMNPFGWRVMGTLFGIAMIPCIYFFAKRLFKKAEYAFLAAFLMTFDFMHFTQTRIATIDVYAVFFIILMYYYMYKFTQINIYTEGLKKALVALGLSGLCFALGAATKWSCIYAGAGLAVILFKEIYERYEEYRAVKNCREIENINPYNKILKSFDSYYIKIIGCCVIFFIIFPVIVYGLSHIPYMLLTEGAYDIKGIIKLQVDMYKYHSELVATHPFASKWFEWPIIYKPIWYYSGQASLPLGKISSIVSMGNPAIWWLGAITAIATAVIGIRKRDKVAFIIIVGALSQLVPWMLVPRLTFIYHYFATVPFLMLSIVYIFAYLNEKYTRAKYFIYGYMAIVMVLFFMFYPVISGMIVNKSYVANFLRWFQTWYFYS